MARPRPPARPPQRARAGSARGVRVVVSTAPSRVAARIARALVEGGTAACVQVVPGARSVYRWRGKVETARESVLVIKTTAAAQRACLLALARAHPYEVPEALVFTPNSGLTAYLRWVSDSTHVPRS